MTGPIQDLKIVDASLVMPGAIAGMLLADHGANVIKVEPRGGTFFAHDLTRKSWDRGKKSVELDLLNEADRAEIRALAVSADVFIHSLEAEEAKALGLDYASLAQDAPWLVVCGLTAYGQDTPHADRPYGESLAAARLGTMVDKASSFRKGPVYLGHPALHYGQAFLAVINILSALNEQRQSGKGQDTEASLLDAMSAQSPMNNWWQEDGLSYIKAGDSGAVDRFGNTRLVTGMFECGDGLYLQIHTGGPGGFKRGMDILGFGDRIQKIDGPEMAVPLTEDEYQVARVDIFEAFKTRPRAEWIEMFQKEDVAALPVLEPAEVLLDEQVEFVGQRIEIEDPDFGKIYQAAPALRFGSLKIDNPVPAPAVGAHNGDLKNLKTSPRAVAKGETGAMLRAPLEGVRVLDFSSFFACGFAGRLLSDLGADVIKVETPAGDQMRPLPDVFDAAQRGKRGVVLNLKSPEGLAAAKDLIKTADAMMHNLRPGKADKLGLGYDDIAKINPDIIYGYLPGYGSKGPKSYLKSFAPLVSGWTGLLYEGGGEGNPPTRSVFGNEDYNNGFLGAVGVLMALEMRRQTGKGDYFECPQLHSSLWTTSEHFLDADKNIVYGFRLDQAQMGFNALDRLYRTKDEGWLCISCRSDERFAALARAIGQTDLLAEPRFATPRARSENDAALLDILTPFFSSLTTQQAVSALEAAGAPCEIARETSWAREVLWEDWALATNRVFEDKASIYGHVREFGLFNRLSRTPGVHRGSAPRLGQHTREVLAEIGYSPERIEELIASKAALQTDPKPYVSKAVVRA